MDAGKGCGTAIFIAFITGGLIGAGLTLLFAPSSGGETRRKIKDTTLDVKEKAINKVETAKETLEEAVDEIKTTVKAAVEAGKETFKKTKEELEKEAEEA